MKISGVILLAICCMCVACNHVHKAPAVSFYYWRTVYELSEIEHQTLQENEVNKMYIRYFDVDLDSRGKPRPESPIQIGRASCRERV